MVWCGDGGATATLVSGDGATVHNSEMTNHGHAIVDGACAAYGVEQ